MFINKDFDKISLPSDKFGLLRYFIRNRDV